MLWLANNSSLLKAQTPTTFTANNAQITDTLISGGVIEAHSIHASDSIIGSDVIVAEQNLDVHGNLNLNGNLKITSLGGGNKFKPLFVTTSGNIVNSLETEPGWLDPSVNNSCNPYSVPWRIGGNTIANSGYTDISAGTCDNFDFILKANNSKRVWIKPDGKIGFGTVLPSQKYHFADGNILLDGPNDPAGNNIKLKIVGAANNQGLNVETTHSTPFNYNTLLRVNLNFTKAFSVLNTASNQAGNETFLIWGDGKTNIGYQPGSLNNAKLNINVNGGEAFNIYDQLTNHVNITFMSDGKAYFGSKRIQANHIHANSDFQFHGKLACKELVVIDPVKWADFVFDTTYCLKPLKEVESFYLKNKHLEGVPSEKQVKENGINASEMFAILLQKIEELTIYTAEQDKEIRLLKKEIKQLKKHE